MKKLPTALLLLAGCLLSVSAAPACQPPPDRCFEIDQSKIYDNKAKLPGSNIAVYGPTWKRPVLKDDSSTKQKTIWEAPTSFDRLIEEDIKKTQNDKGSTSAEAGRLMVAYARQYLDRKEYVKAARLADKIILLNSKAKIQGISISQVRKLKSDAYEKGNLSYLNNLYYSQIPASNITCRSLNQPISSEKPTAINIGPGLRQISY